MSPKTYGDSEAQRALTQATLGYGNVVSCTAWSTAVSAYTPLVKISRDGGPS